MKPVLILCARVVERAWSGLRCEPQRNFFCLACQGGQAHYLAFHPTMKGYLANYSIYIHIFEGVEHDWNKIVPFCSSGLERPFPFRIIELTPLVPMFQCFGRSKGFWKKKMQEREKPSNAKLKNTKNRQKEKHSFFTGTLEHLPFFLLLSIYIYIFIYYYSITYKLQTYNETHFFLFHFTGTRWNIRNTPSPSRKKVR